MLRFECDYNASAHGRILRRLCEDGNRYPGYGADELCAEASRKIRAAFSCPDAEIHYLVGGTQTNQIVVDCLLDSCQGVVAAATGHVSVHEAGAVEYTGHKVLQIEGVEGKVVPARLENYLKGFFADVNHEHMVFPGMVYISHPTEYGTLYSLGELTQLSRICREYEIPLYMDGARLGYGLMSGHTDVTAADVARLTDVFYIGGTKVGALFGEALVFPRGNAPAHFMTKIKQHGALLAKGWLLGEQFDELFTDGLYFEISRHAIEAAQRLTRALEQKGYCFFMPPVTNQIFVILENGKMRRLEPDVAFDYWEKYDEGHFVVRFATGWATADGELDALIALL